MSIWAFAQVEIAFAVVFRAASIGHRVTRAIHLISSWDETNILCFGPIYVDLP